MQHSKLRVELAKYDPASSPDAGLVSSSFSLRTLGRLSVRLGVLTTRTSEGFAKRHKTRIDQVVEANEAAVSKLLEVKTVCVWRLLKGLPLTFLLGAMGDRLISRTHQRKAEEVLKSPAMTQGAALPSKCGFKQVLHAKRLEEEDARFLAFQSLADQLLELIHEIVFVTDEECAVQDIQSSTYRNLWDTFANTLHFFDAAGMNRVFAGVPPSDIASATVAAVWVLHADAYLKKVMTKNPWFEKWATTRAVESKKKGAGLQWPANSFPEADDDESSSNESKHENPEFFSQRKIDFACAIWAVVGEGKPEYQELQAFGMVVKAGVKRQALTNILSPKVSSGVRQTHGTYTVSGHAYCFGNVKMCEMNATL